MKSLVKTVDYMKRDGHDESTIRRIVFSNAMAFYGNSPRWKPELDLTPVDPHTFQR